MDIIVHGVAKSWTQLSNFHFSPFDICVIFGNLISLDHNFFIFKGWY